MVDEASGCRVELRLGRHSSARHLSVLASVDERRIASPGRNPFAPKGSPLIDPPKAPPPNQLAEAFVASLRGGIPKLGHSELAIVKRSGKSAKGATTRHDVDLQLPPCRPDVLQYLANMMMCSAGRNGTTDIAITETGSQDLEQFDQDSIRTTTSMPKIAFGFVRSSRDVVKMGSLNIRFRAEITPSCSDDLERAVRAWFGIVGNGGFVVSCAGGFSAGTLGDIVDAYPDEWIAHFEGLFVDDAACAPLLQRLADIHAASPIVEVSLR